METNTITQADYTELCSALPDNSVDMILTDPPYLMTANKWEVEIDLALMWACFERIIKPNGAIVMTGAQPFTSKLIVSNLSLYRYSWVWLKDNGTDFLNVNRKPFEAHEDIVVFYKKQPAYNPQMESGEPYIITTGVHHRSNLQQPEIGNNFTSVNSGYRYPKSYQHFKRERGLHPTQKPVALFEYLIRTYTQAGDIVLDPFAGSGTTAVACIKTNRRYICGDQTAEYVELARKRIATCDPYQDTPVDDGVTQLSMFSSVSEAGHD